MISEARCTICRSYLDLEDLFCSNCGTENPNGVDSTGLGTDVNQLEGMLRAALEHELAGRGRAAALPPPEHGPARAGDLRSNLVDPAEAANVLGWRPTVSLADGLARTAAWFAGA